MTRRHVAKASNALPNKAFVSLGSHNGWSDALERRACLSSSEGVATEGEPAPADLDSTSERLTIRASESLDRLGPVTSTLSGFARKTHGRHVLRLKPYPPYMKALRKRTRRVFGAAKLRGDIRPQPKHCEGCQRPVKQLVFGLEAHHPDYEFPLQIVYLCRWCHTEANGKQHDEYRKLAFGHPALDAVFERVQSVDLPVRGDVN